MGKRAPRRHRNRRFRLGSQAVRVQSLFHACGCDALGKRGARSAEVIHGEEKEKTRFQSVCEKEIEGQEAREKIGQKIGQEIGKEKNARKTHGDA
jgi:hypothetical protein